MRKISLRATKYQISKIIYIILLEIALVTDLILAISGYEILKELIGNVGSLAILALCLSGLLGGILYLLDRWQIEHLTIRRECK